SERFRHGELPPDSRGSFCRATSRGATFTVATLQDRLEAPGRGPVGRVRADRPGMDGIAEGQPECGVCRSEARRALPDAVADRLPQTLAASVVSEDGWRPADRGRQLADVELPPRMAEQLGEVVHALRVPHPHDSPLVRDGPDIALPAETPLGRRPPLRWGAGSHRRLTLLALHSL